MGKTHLGQLVGGPHCGARTRLATDKLVIEEHDVELLMDNQKGLIITDRRTIHTYHKSDQPPQKGQDGQEVYQYQYTGGNTDTKKKIIIGVKKSEQ